MWNLFSSPRRKAMSLYKRGMKKAKANDIQGAIAAYTEVIEMSDVPPDVKAMALFNRALTYGAEKDDAKAREDLASVLAMPEAPSDVATAARQKLQRWDKRQH